ncbi:MAG: outer membrane beta-barrel protein [Calditrichaeota bacterium]|nr:outer membrane beta-barrel protein [Calditrichota bacterium]
MRYFIFISLALIFTVSGLFAQEDTGYFKDGSKAVLFQFNAFSPNSYNGGVGGKYFVSEEFAIRAGLIFANAKQTLPFQGTAGVDGESSASQYGIFAAVEKHLTDSRISPYIGGGFMLVSTSTERETAEADPADQQTIKNSRGGELGYQGGSEFGFALLGGFEFFVIKNLSLGAEYQLYYSKISRKDEEVTQGNVTVTFEQGSTTRMGLSSSGILTLAFYF